MTEACVAPNKHKQLARTCGRGRTWPRAPKLTTVLLPPLLTSHMAEAPLVPGALQLPTAALRGGVLVMFHLCTITSESFGEVGK